MSDLNQLRLKYAALLEAARARRDEAERAARAAEIDIHRLQGALAALDDLEETARRQAAAEEASTG